MINEIVYEILAFEIDTRIMDALLGYKIARKVFQISKCHNSKTIGARRLIFSVCSNSKSVKTVQPIFNILVDLIWNVFCTEFRKCNSVCGIVIFRYSEKENDTCKSLYRRLGAK